MEGGRNAHAIARAADPQTTRLAVAGWRRRRRLGGGMAHGHEGQLLERGSGHAGTGGKPAGRMGLPRPLRREPGWAVAGRDMAPSLSLSPTEIQLQVVDTSAFHISDFTSESPGAELQVPGR